jgi:hypothetical protein
MTDEAAILAFLANPPSALPRPVVAALWAAIPAADRRAQRDALLRRAAELLPPAGSWGKAAVLANLARPPRRPREAGCPLPEPDLSTAQGCLAAAMEIAPGRWGRLSARQIHRLIAPAIGSLRCRRTRSNA